MPIALKELRNQLSAIEPDVGTFDGIGPSEIPLLEQLLQDKEAWMASRAVFALSRIPDPKALTIFSRAASDPRPEIRIAVAASVNNLKPIEANKILLKLLDDTDLSVRKFAIKSVSKSHSASVLGKLRKLEKQDPVQPIRNEAKDRLQKLELVGPDI